jgi:hypothetical protein
MVFLTHMPLLELHTLFRLSSDADSRQEPQLTSVPVTTVHPGLDSHLYVAIYGSFGEQNVMRHPLAFQWLRLEASLKGMEFTFL